jgi:hypothetical protein
MFEGWSEFYILIGAADAALIGLLFVVTTLSASMHIGGETLSRGAAFYMTPTLYHFVTVLVMSALAVVPHVAGVWVAAVLAFWATAGAVYAAAMGVAMRTNPLPSSGQWADVWGYGILPAAMYLGLLAAAWLSWREAANAPYAIAIGLVVLMVIGIRNAWDLVMFIVPRTVDEA